MNFSTTILQINQRDTHKLKVIMRVVSLAIIAVVLSFKINLANAATVESISGEVLKDLSSTEVYWVVSVTCSGVDEARLMQQLSGESKWCAVDGPQLCADSKSALAKQLCHDEYELLLLGAENKEVNVTSEAAPTPEVAKPEVAKPEVAKPEVAKPEVAKPEVAKPEVTKPEVTKPEVTKPEVTKPEVTKPEVTKPEVAKPEVAKPEVAKPEVTKPEVAKPEVAKPAEASAPAVSVPAAESDVSAPTLISSPVQQPVVESAVESVVANKKMTLEEIAAEEELIRIEEEKLELRRKEIELQKQKLTQ